MIFKVISTRNLSLYTLASIIELTSDVIVGRTASLDLYLSLHAVPTAEQAIDDKGHQYSIRTLREVGDSLIQRGRG